MNEMEELEIYNRIGQITEAPQYSMIFGEETDQSKKIAERNSVFIPPKGLIEHNPRPMHSKRLVIFTFPTGARTHNKTEFGSAILVGFVVD